jgi:hypothetical protein
LTSDAERAAGSDLRWGVFLAASFAAGLAVSWQRWADPVIDSGREMNQPLRLIAGERLYAGVGHIYGPLSPHLNAALYRAFGPSLGVLYADGIVSAFVILALVYTLARRIMSPAAAGTATLTVMWLCALKPAGNYILPYSFNALHGTLFALLTLAIAAPAIARPSATRFAMAGIVAGVALLAKLEMGLAALAAGCAAAWLSWNGSPRRAVLRLLVFAAGATLVAASTYGAIAAQVGWRTLAVDSWLLPFHLPAPLAYFNASISGFDHPLASLARMLSGAMKLVIFALLVAAIAGIAAGGAEERRRAWRRLAGAAVAGAVLSLTVGLDWGSGPFLAMPLVLVALLLWLARRPLQARDREVVLYALFALVQLARVLLHVRSGGAYGSFLVPMSVVVFVYLWVDVFARALPDPAVRRAASALVLALLMIAAAATAVVLGYRYRRSDAVRISTARGTLYAPPETATAWNEALAFIDARTHPGDAIAVLPEGTSLTFLSGRRNPLREEIVTPGFLDTAGEARAIRALDQSDTRLILIVNRATREFGAEAFGRDYCRTLMQWIEAHYAPCATFGAQDPRLRIGDAPFFVRAYCRDAGIR